MLTDTEAEVAAGVRAEAGRGRLEVLGALPAGEVRAGKVGRATNKLGNVGSKSVDDVLRELARGNGGLVGGEDGEVLLPAVGETALDTTSELGTVLGVLSLVLLEESVPLGVGLLTGLGLLGPEVGDLGRNNKRLLGVEAELGLELLDVVSLEGGTVDVVGAGLGRAVTNGGLEGNEGGLGVVVASLGDGASNGVEVVVTGSDVEDLPAVRAEAGLDVLGERDSGVTVNGDVVVVPDGNEVAELEVTKMRVSVEKIDDVIAKLVTYPASEAASEATPSWRQPSPRKTMTG